MVDKKENQKRIDQFDYLKNAACVTDCTGLIPSSPESSSEENSYKDLLQYQPPVIKPNKKEKN